ncbi:MAG: hypothetical protein K8S98_10540, partial [Planctomycetes bacterium]|nr:hypothetical protein [Planctomycetota bacterium]
MAGIDELARPSDADEQLRDGREGALGGRETDALRRHTSVVAAQRIESFERQGEMRAALVACERVDLVDDH